jgi:hypothetical protein
MHLSIHLNRQSSFVSVKINDVITNYLLPAEMPAVKPVGAQVLPENLLGIRQIVT